MKKPKSLGFGILLGLVIGLIYGYFILATVMHDTSAGIALGSLMGVGSGGSIVIALQSQAGYRH